MATADEVERFARERRDADARYNDALTALDREVVAAAARPALGREDAHRFATTLIVFLQQITRFVESKDRELAAQAGARIESVDRSLAAVAELRTHIAILQRSVQSIRAQLSSVEDASAAPATGQSTIAHQQSAIRSPQSTIYVGFEDEFRGSDATIAEKLRGYVPIFAGARDVVDVGCGRGELLAALRDAGISARGVDANADMAAIARERGLDAMHGDALAFLESATDDSLGGLAATQVVEHLEPAYLMRLLDAASRKLRSGAPIVLETINAACWLAFFSSYVRDVTHVRPLHPDTLQYLLRANGFERVEIRYSAPVPDHMKMKTVDLPAGVLAAGDPASAALGALAQTINANAVILNNLMFTHLDYAAIGYRS